MTKKEEYEDQLRWLSNGDYIPKDHSDYLFKLSMEFTPKVIYDIGSCVLHWTKKASEIWPDAKYYLFDGTDTVEFLYKETDYDYHIGVLSDVDDKEVIFYQCNTNPGGNSYYKEYGWATDVLFGKDSERKVITTTVDTVVKNKGFLYPDLIKMDIQGCEIDVLRGMENVIKHCKHLIVELQHEVYNTGALLSKDSIPIIESMGFELISPLFCNNGVDGDYHFKKK